MTPPGNNFDSRERSRFRRSLMAWYARHARALPWRAKQGAYGIWLSEIMLQQTTVAAVIPYFERFVARFPTLEELAKAPEEEVLRLWEGLGYYRRARHLHQAARHVTSQRAGQFPKEVSQLMELPGIGRYTAGAIASFAFDRPAPILEANTLRLYCRLMGFEGDPKSSAAQRALWQFAESLLPRSGSGRLNQALMELGSQVCTIVDPGCDRCPVARHCAALAQGKQQSIPHAAARPKITHVTELALAVERRGRYLLRKRRPDERWAGMWDFLRYPADRLAVGVRHGSSGDSSAALARLVHEETGMQVVVGDLLTEICHSVTRYRITLKCYAAVWRSGQVRVSSHAVSRGKAEQLRWLAPEDFGELPLSTSARRLARLIAKSASE
jgi:A/G-specific adenine glycosylase